MPVDLELGTVRWRKVVDLAAFSWWKPALVHICDHLLTRPEIWTWALYIDFNPKIVDIKADYADFDRRREFAKRLWQENQTAEEQGEAQRLYDEYVKEIGTSLEEANARGWYWYWHDGRIRQYSGLGMSGLKIGWTPKSITTAYFALPENQPPRGYLPRDQQPLPREPARRCPLRQPPPALANDRRLKGYEAFGKCLRVVRRHYASALQEEMQVYAPPEWHKMDVDPRAVPSFIKWSAELEKSGR